MVETELLTTSQAAEYLGISRQHAHSLTKQGYGKRYGPIWMFTREELDRWKTQPAKGPGGRPKRAAGTLTAAHPAKVTKLHYKEQHAS